jgi:hypothetical protein
MKRWNFGTKVRAARILQTFARRYTKDARSKIQARSIISICLVQFTLLAHLSECLGTILQDAKDLRARLHRCSVQGKFSLRGASVVSDANTFTVPRLGELAGSSPHRALEPVSSGDTQVLLGLLSDYGQPPESDEECGGESEPCQSSASEHEHHVLDPAGSESVEHVEHAYKDRRKIGWLQYQRNLLESKVYVLEDELAQAKAEIAKLRLHTEIRIGIELSKVSPNIIGFENGKKVFKPPARTPKQTADDTYYRLFGTHKSVGPGPYANCSWYDWSNPGKPKPPLTHAFVANYIKERDAERKAREEARLRAEKDDPVWQAFNAKAIELAKRLADSRRRAIEREAAEAEQAARMPLSEWPTLGFRPHRTAPRNMA